MLDNLESIWRTCAEKFVLETQSRALGSESERYAAHNGRQYAEAQVLFYDWKHDYLNEYFKYVKSIYNYAVGFRGGGSNSSHSNQVVKCLR